MSDRELLEAAAKAAGMSVIWNSGCGEWCRVREFAHDPPRRIGDWEIWNPLTDDGDALRLAVKLEIQLDLRHSMNTVRAYGAPQGMIEEGAKDHYAATRRAIVRAAAAIGEAP